MRVLAGPASTLTLCVCCIALLLPRPALADFTGLQTVERMDLPICQPSEPEIPYQMDICNVYAVFNDPADRLISVGFTSASTDDPNGFFQHSLGGDSSPSCNLIPLFPTVECDSYITVGLDCDAGSDSSALDPDFDSTAFNTLGSVAGGWYSTNPNNGQGVPDANGRVLIAQFSVKQNRGVTGALSVFATIGGAEDATEFPLQAFDCFGGGGGGASPSGPSGPSGPGAQGGEQGAGASCGCDAGGGPCLCPDVELGGSSEPAMAVNPLNPLNIAVSWNPDNVAPDNSPQQLTVSTDGGQTWCGDPNSPCAEPLEGILPPGFCDDDPLYPCLVAGDTSLAFDSAGRLFWCYLGAASHPHPTPPVYDIIVLQVDPTTGTPVGDPTLVINDVTISRDKPWIAVDSTSNSPYADRLYVTWTTFPDATPLGQTLVSYKDVLGSEWSAPAAISPSNGSEGWVTNPHIAVGPGGVVYAAYHSQPGMNCNPDGVSGQIIVRRSMSGGVTWPEELTSVAYDGGEADITWNFQHCAEGNIPQTRFLNIGSCQPWIVPDPLMENRVYIVAADDPQIPHGDLQDSLVYIVRSDDFGATWTALGPEPKLIESEPPTPADTFQVFPTAAIDRETGDLVVLWYDNRNGATFLEDPNDPQSELLFYLDLFFSISTNQGAGFTTPAQINDLPFDHVFGAQAYTRSPGTKRMGEYVGVALTTDPASATQYLYAAWTGNDDTGQQTVFGTDQCDGCPWDADDDGSVGAFDLAVLLGGWGTNPCGPPDFDGNGDVGPFDLALLLGHWGPCP